LQRSFQIFHNFLRDDVGSRKICAVFE